MAIDYSYTQLTQAEMAEVAKLVKKNGGSYLVAMAMLLGKVADKMAEACMGMAERLDTIAGIKADNPKAGNLGENKLTAEFRRMVCSMLQLSDAIALWRPARWQRPDISVPKTNWARTPPPPRALSGLCSQFALSIHYPCLSTNW